MGNEARIAALDQELARLGEGVDRGNRTAFRASVVVACIAAGLILYQVIAQPPVDRLEVVAYLAMVVIANAGGAVQARTIRSCRQEIRMLRSGSLPED